jgi:ketosteroid isomerase-like protein
MRKALFCAAAVMATLTGVEVRADPGDDVRDVYARFLAAQNARDLAHVRSVLWDSPKFLWVSDGMSVWGPDALVDRMSQFQKAEVWHVEPDLAKAVPVELSGTTAYLHLPLVLTIGSSANPDRLRFLVSVLGIQTPAGWRIAALFTTTEKPK